MKYHVQNCSDKIKNDFASEELFVSFAIFLQIKMSLSANRSLLRIITIKKPIGKF